MCISCIQSIKDVFHVCYVVYPCNQGSRTSKGVQTRAERRGRVRQAAREGQAVAGMHLERIQMCIWNGRAIGGVMVIAGGRLQSLWENPSSQLRTGGHQAGGGNSRAGACFRKDCSLSERENRRARGGRQAGACRDSVGE